MYLQNVEAAVPDMSEFKQFGDIIEHWLHVRHVNVILLNTVYYW